MLSLILSNKRSRKDAFLIIGSLLVVTALYLTFFRFSNHFPRGISVIFSFIYGIFVTMDVYALFGSISQPARRPSTLDAGPELSFEERTHLVESRYDRLIAELDKEIQHLENQLETEENNELIQTQLEAFRKKRFSFQEEKFTELERLVKETI